MHDVAFSTAVELAQDLRAKRVSSREVTQLYIDQYYDYTCIEFAHLMQYYDYTCIEFARLMADEIGGFIPPPAYAGD